LCAKTDTVNELYNALPNTSNYYCPMWKDKVLPLVYTLGCCWHVDKYHRNVFMSMTVSGTKRWNSLCNMQPIESSDIM